MFESNSSYGNHLRRQASETIYLSLHPILGVWDVGWRIYFFEWVSFSDYFSGEYIHFGRVRPVHVGTVTLSWLLSANIGLMLYFIPRLCGVPFGSLYLAIVAGSFGGLP